MLYNCKKISILPPKNFIKYNTTNEYKKIIQIDFCLKQEIQYLWNQGIRTTGCCCGHGRNLGFIQVLDEDINAMYDLGYQNYIYEDDFGGVERKDTFIPKSTRHYYNGYTDSYLG